MEVSQVMGVAPIGSLGVARIGNLSHHGGAGRSLVVGIAPLAPPLFTRAAPGPLDFSDGRAGDDLWTVGCGSQHHLAHTLEHQAAGRRAQCLVPSMRPFF